MNDQERQVIADIFLAYDTPVRLDIETQARPVYALPLGMIVQEMECAPYVRLDGVTLVNNLPKDVMYTNVQRLA